LLYDRVSLDNVPLQKYIYWSKRLHGPEAEESVIHVESLEEIISDHDVIHISFSGSCALMKEMECVLVKELGDSVNVLATIYPELDFTLIDILPPDASKGRGLEKLTEIDVLILVETWATAPFDLRGFYGAHDIATHICATFVSQRCRLLESTFGYPHLCPYWTADTRHGRGSPLSV